MNRITTATMPLQAAFPERLAGNGLWTLRQRANLTFKCSPPLTCFYSLLYDFKDVFSAFCIETYRTK